MPPTDDPRERARRRELARQQQSHQQLIRRRTFLGAGFGALVASAAAAIAYWKPWRSGSNQSAPTTVPSAPATTTTTAPAVVASANGPVARWVVEENAKPGTASWQLSNIAQKGDIEGYADTVSAAVGNTVAVYVSTVFPTFHVEAYRMGWYQGLGARLVWQSPEIRGVKQLPPVVTAGTNMVEAHWQPSTQVMIDQTFPPGTYLLKLVASTGPSRWIPLIVRDDASTAAYVVQSSVTTWQAYNLWGGYSLYGKGTTTSDFRRRSRIVSFDRPYLETGGGSDFAGLELPLVMLIEQLGLDVTYTTDIDTHAHPELLLNHKMFCSLGHDEYWSKQMRDGVEAARDHGVNLAFFGANASYRQIRLEPSPLGPNRHQVCYKSTDEDPLRRSAPALTTVNWRDAPVSRPESEMIGQQYDCNPVRADMVIADPTAWVFAGSGVTAGERLGGLIGSEYDRYIPGQKGPSNVQILAHSPVTCHEKAGFADMTYYTAPSGAGVFASGTIDWLANLKPPSLMTGRANAVVLQVTKNVLAAFGSGPAGTMHPSVPNYGAVASGRLA
jgi:hypothetical protein